MENRIAEKFAKLHAECKRYPEIVLSSVEERGGYLKHGPDAKVYVKPSSKAKDGFIEKFCL